MRMVTAIIKHQRLDEVRRALTKMEIHGMTTMDVKGFGRQKGHKEHYRGMEVDVHFLPKVKIEVAIEESRTNEVVEAIKGAALTSEDGSIGDGKIFIHELVDTIRIRTGETGREAL